MLAIDDAPAGRASAGLQYSAAALVLFLTLIGSQLATPLYAIWQARFGLSTTAVTIIYACYGAGVTLGLVFGGRLGDQLGRKPMIYVGIALTAVASVIYLLAASAGYLVAARLINGIAIGVISGPIVAAIVELQPQGDRAAASRIASIVTLTSPAAGLLLATSIAHFAHAPDLILTLPFVIQLFCLATAMALALMFRETILPENLSGWRRVSFAPRRLVLPPSIRSGFIFASTAGALSWANTGLFLSLGPMLASQITGSTDKLFGGLTIVAFLSTAGIVQVIARGLHYRSAIAISLALLPPSLFLICATLVGRSMAGLVIGAIMAGIGQGLGWMGSTELVNRTAPAELRASIVSWLYVAGYAGTIVPVILTGLAADILGLPIALFILSTALSALAIVLFVQNRSFARNERGARA